MPESSTARRFRPPTAGAKGQPVSGAIVLVGRGKASYRLTAELRAPMKAFLIDGYGGADRVHEAEVPSPEPGPGDLTLSVRAASVNPVDAKIRAGGIKPLIKFKMPLILGNDLSGVVTAIGAAVTRFKVGDDVYARLDRERLGAFAQFAVVSEGAAALKPSNLSHEEAASMPLVGLTAWQALVELGNVQPGQRVLIHAGSGGLGTLAIQVAKARGAIVATTASARNADLLRALGASQIVDYRTARFEDEVKDCDLVLDTQGGETLLRSFSVTRRGGMIVSVNGVPDGKFARAYGLNPLMVFAMGLMSRKITAAARKADVRFEWHFVRPDGDQLAILTSLVESGALKPVIDRIFPFAQTREALAYVESGRATGKVVISLAARAER